MPIDLHGGLSARQHSALSHYPSHQAEGLTDVNTNSVVPVDMPNLSIGLTTGNIPVFISFSWSGRHNQNNGETIFVIDIDGTPLTGMDCHLTTANNRISGSMQALVTLPAGIHTIKIQWKVGAGIVTNDVASVADRAHRRLEVIELPW